MTSLLRLVRDNADAVEADIRARYQLDYHDLNWRTRAALIRHLPADSAIAGVDRDGPHWSVEAHLLDDVRMWLMVLAGAERKHITAHPQRPKSVRPQDPARQKKLIDARKRARERRLKIAAGEIT